MTVRFISTRTPFENVQIEEKSCANLVLLDTFLYETVESTFGYLCHFCGNFGLAHSDQKNQHIKGFLNFHLISHTEQQDLV